jgi:3-oxoacyl-[acyl-carrier-protein] synthase-3
MNALLQHVRIAGIAVAVPKNEEIIADGSYGTPEMRVRFSTMTGIRSRRLCTPDQFCSDLATNAASHLLDELGWDRAEVENLIFITQTPDVEYPATACMIQHRLGLSTNCAAFDVNLGCSGYPYGLHIAGKLTSARAGAKTVLLVGDAAGKPNLSVEREKIPPLFGDAASATALEWCADAAPMHFELHTDGSGWDAITQRRPGGRPGFTTDNFHHEVIGNEVRISSYQQMKGEDVFNFSVRTAPRVVESTLSTVGWAKETVDAFVFHQANRLINETIRKRLGLRPEHVPSTLERFGNTSSCTIPLTLVEALGTHLRNGHQRLILCGFGVGLSWGTVACELDRIVCPELIEL